MDAEKLTQLKQFVDRCKADPSILTDPSLSFFREYLESLGAELPSSAYKPGESGNKSKPYVVESDDDMEENEDEPQPKPFVVEEEEEIVESDVEIRCFLHEIRNKCVTDLNIDVLRHIMLFVARSPDGALSFARALSVCKSFRELGKDTEILKCVAFGEQSAKDRHQSFWGLNGLLNRCAFAENADAGSLLIKVAQKKRLALLAANTREKMQNQVAQMKRLALLAANTREKMRAFELLQKEYEERKMFRC